MRTNALSPTITIGHSDQVSTVTQLYSLQIMTPEVTLGFFPP